jgi:hypothetical protein
MADSPPRNPNRPSTPRLSAAARLQSSPTTPSLDRVAAVPPASSLRLLLGVGLVSVVCLAGFVAAIGWIGHTLLRTDKSNAEDESAESKPAARAISSPPARQVVTLAPSTSRTASPKFGSPKVASHPAPEASSPNSDPKPPSTGTPTPAPTEQPPVSVVEVNAFDEIEQSGRRFNVPPFPSDPAHSGEWVRLAAVKVSSPADLSLTILGAETAFGKELQVGITRKSQTVAAPEWKVLAHSKADISASQMPIGAFVLDNGSLRFRWDPGASPNLFPGRLKYCLLRLEYKDQHVDVSLSGPVVNPLVGLNVKGTQFLRKDPRDAPSLPPTDQLHFEAILIGLPGRSGPEKKELLPSIPGSITLEDPASGQPLLDLELKLVPQDDSWNLRVTYLGHIPSTHQTTHQKDAEGKPRPCSLTDIRAQRKRIKPMLPNPTTSPGSLTKRSRGNNFNSGPASSKQRNPMTRLNEIKALDGTLAKIERLFEDMELGTQVGLRIFFAIEGQNVEVLRSESTSVTTQP